ncbi:Flp family type IVb pilin [Bosea sp. Leaf344]|uniref:Flp family type IVb pilin n=1 Tax=Bosea sp. Leaf344 TaxID=1736346 RepID=UPI0009E6ECD7|nr:Flp family type IVb pilin [Bosea sp. Leaf344]
MQPLRTQLKSFAADQGGATMIEYGLIASLVSIGIIATVSVIGAQVTAFFQNVASGFKS